MKMVSFPIIQKNNGQGDTLQMQKIRFLSIIFYLLQKVHKNKHAVRSYAISKEFFVDTSIVIIFYYAWKEDHSW